MATQVQLNPNRLAHKAIGCRNQGGFNLIEVLIALLVLALGLLGLAALQNFSLRANHQSMQRTQATVAIQSIIDRMRANPAGVGGGSYDLPAYTNAPPGSPNCASTVCTTIDMAHYDLANWIQMLTSSQALGASGEARIRLIDASTMLGRQYEVAVRWWEGDLQIEQTMNVYLPTQEWRT
jgi:type IV pilus assembly protein PilV